MQLGELLIRAQVLTQRQLDAGIQRQKQQGGRLASVLIEQQQLTHDQAAAALGRHHGVHPALKQHLHAIHPDAARLLSPKDVYRFKGFPFGFSTANGRRVVVAMRDPRDTEVIQAMQEVLGMPVVPTAIPEVSLYTLLASIYKIPRPPRYSGQASSNPQVSNASQNTGGIQLVDLDDDAVSRNAPQIFESGSHQVTGLAAAKSHESIKPLVPEATPTPVSEESTTRAHAPLSFEDARALLDNASDRDEIVEILLRHVCSGHSFALFLAKKSDQLVGHMNKGAPLRGEVNAIAIPTMTNSFFDGVLQRKTPLSAVVDEKQEAEKDFFGSFKVRPSNIQVLVVPLKIKARIVGFVYSHENPEDYSFSIFESTVKLANLAGEKLLEIVQSKKKGS